MIRTFISALLLAGVVGSVSHAGAPPQPEPKPQAKHNAEVWVLGSAGAGRSYLGVDIRDITQDRLGPLKLKEERGVEVTMLDQDAPAAKAGIREHDVILDFNGTAVESEEQLRRLIRETPPGRTVILGISRDGNPLKVSVQLAEHSKVVAEAFPRVPAPPRLPDNDFGNRIDIPAISVYTVSSSLGMQTENLTPQLGDFFGVKNGEGVLVRSVDKGSAAEKAGLKAGDVVVKIGDEKLSDRSDLARIMRKHRSGGKLAVSVVREKREQTFTVDVPARGARDSSALFDWEEFQGNWADMEDLLDESRLNLDSLPQVAGMIDLEKSFELKEKLLPRVHQLEKLQLKDLDRQLLNLDEQLHLNLHEML